MADTFEKLLAEAAKLPPEDRSRLVRLLANTLRQHGVRDSEVDYNFALLPHEEIDAMTSVTIVLPDDLARQAHAAGLLAETRLAELIRRALNERSANQSPGDHGSRTLVRRNGRLVVEALPDEHPITDEDVREFLNKVDW